MNLHTSSHNETELEAALTSALEARPIAAIPHDFALRVTTHLHGLPAVFESTLRPKFGRRIALTALALLLAIFFALATLTPHTPAPDRTVLTAIEWTFAAEFILLTVWLSLRTRSLF